MNLELEAGSTRLSISGTNWLKLVLESPGPRPLGAEVPEELLPRFLKSLERSEPTKAALECEGGSVKEMFWLWENHTTFLAGSTEEGMSIFLVGREGDPPFHRVDLTDEVRESWRDTLEQGARTLFAQLMEERLAKFEQLETPECFQGSSLKLSQAATSLRTKLQSFVELRGQEINEILRLKESLEIDTGVLEANLNLPVQARKEASNWMGEVRKIVWEAEAAQPFLGPRE